MEPSKDIRTEFSSLVDELYLDGKPTPSGSSGSFNTSSEEEHISEEHNKFTSDANGAGKRVVSVESDKSHFKLPNGMPELKKLRDFHYEIIRRAALGHKYVDIADELGIDNSTVHRTLNSPMARERLDIIRGARDHSAGEILNQFRALSPIALEVYKEAILDRGVHIRDRIRAANEVLDRAGHTPIQKHAHLHGELMQEDIEEIKKRARSNGIVVSVEEAQIKEETDDED